MSSQVPGQTEMFDVVSDHVEPHWPDFPGRTFHIDVVGHPVPQGSKTAFISKSTGRPMVKDNSAIGLGNWRAAISLKAIAERAGSGPLTGPLSVILHFRLKRPAFHLGAKGNVKASAPSRPDVRPDIDKLARAVLDALTDAKVWGDDSQVVTLTANKWFADSAEPEGVAIYIKQEDV